MSVILNQLCAAAGPRATRTLMHVHGGTTIYLSDAPRGRLSRAIVVQDAARVVGALGRGWLYIPSGRRGRSTDRLADVLRAGASVRVAARLAGVSERTVRRQRHRLAASGTR